MASTAQRKSHASKNRVGHLVDGVHEMTDHAADMAGRRVKKVRKSVRGSMRAAGRGIARMEKSFEHGIAARPLISVGTALAAGMGIAFGLWALDCFMNRDR
jgi:hypothetical protein